MFQIFDSEHMITSEFDSLIEALSYIDEYKVISAITQDGVVVVTQDEIEALLNS